MRRGVKKGNGSVRRDAKCRWVTPGQIVDKIVRVQFSGRGRGGGDSGQARNTVQNKICVREWEGMRRLGRRRERVVVR